MTTKTVGEYLDECIDVLRDTEKSIREATQSIKELKHKASAYDELKQHMEDCGWSVHSESGYIYNGEKSFETWHEAIISCIEVAS
jgi:hypothetical protein